MEEIFDIATLANNGYTLDKNNALLNGAGEYVPSVTIDGKTMNSAIGAEEFSSIQNNEAILKEANFTPDPYSELPEYAQQDRAIAKHHLNKYQAAPTETSIPAEVVESQVFVDVFEEDKIEKQAKGEAAYPDIQTMVEGEEGDSFIQNIDQQNKGIYKDLIRARKVILKDTPDIKTELEEIGEVISTMPATMGNSEFSNELLGGVIDFASNFFATGFGIDDEDQKEKLDVIDKEIKRLETPFAMKTIEDLDTRIAEIELLREGDYSNQDALRYDYAEKILIQEKNKLNDFISGDYLDSNIFSTANLIDQGTRGLTGLISEVPAELMLKVDINKGEELDPSQKILADAFSMRDEIGQAQIKQTFLHELGTGINESIKYIGFGKMGRQAGTKAAGKIAKALPEGASRTAKLLSKTAQGVSNVGLQAALHPNTFKAASEKYSGNISETVDLEGNVSYTTDRHTYDTLLKEMELNEKEIDIQLEINKGDAEKTADLVRAKEGLAEAKTSLKTNEPMGALGSLAYGFVESAKESFSETYFGPMMGKIGSGFKKTAPGRFFTNNKLTNWINSTSSPLRDYANKKFGSTVLPGQRLIGSNIEEWGEEVFVQLVPSVGSDWKGYKDQVGELLTSDFHTKVIAQTLVMNKGMQGIGAVSQNWDRYKDNMNVFSKDSREGAKKTFHERKQLRQTIKNLGDINQSSESFTMNLMGTGEGSFNMTDYNNRIKELKTQGLHAEASALESDKIYKQAVQAVNSGFAEDFQKSMTKAQHNKNLSPETKGVIKQLELEVAEMIDDQNTYLNSGAVLDLKSKRRFAKKSLLDIEKAQIESGVDMDEVTRELEAVGLTLADYQTTSVLETVGGEQTFSERDKLARKKLSPEGERYLLLESLKSDIRTNVSNFNSTLKDATSAKTQEFLTRQRDFSKRVDAINKYKFKGKMTAQQFRDIVYPALDASNKTDGLNEKQFDNTVVRIYDALKADEIQAENSMRAAQSAVNTVTETVQETAQEPGVEVPEVVSEPSVEVQAAAEPIKNAAALLQKLTEEHIGQNVVDHGDDNMGDPDSDVIIRDNDSLDFMLPMEEPVEDTMEDLRTWANIFEKQRGAKPTYEDYWQTVVEGYNDKKIFDKETLEWMGSQWKFAGLGASNWNKIWKENYTDLTAMGTSLFQKATAMMRSDEEVTTELKATEKVQKEEVEPAMAVNPSTKKDIKYEETTYNYGKTALTSPKGNYSGLKYNKYADEDADGTGVVYGKEDTKEIAELNEESHLDVKDLLHKDHNQPGDALDLRISTEADWDNPKILVSVNDPISGKASNYIPFSEWIKNNQPEGMSLEEFKTTDRFISKVPIFYVGKKGTDLMHVPDTDWYNALNVIDRTEDVEEVDINNPNPQLLEDIEEGKRTTLTLRKQIIAGEVSQGVIETKMGSPFVFIPQFDEQDNVIPSKSLEEVATDSKVVSFNGVDFVDLNNQIINDVVVLNKDYAVETYNKTTGSSYQTYYLSPIYTENGVKHFTAVGVLRKNEKGENSAHSDDIQTAKYILAAKDVLHKNKPGFNMTVEEAQTIRKQIREKTGLDIRTEGNASILVNSLIALKPNGDTVGSKVFSAFDNDVPAPLNNETVNRPFIYALFYGDYTPIQNTGLNKNRKSHGLSVKKEGTSFTVEKVAPTYEEFLRKRLSTNVMGYNMGTEQDPAFTISVQPTFRMRPIVGEVEVETVQEVENTQPLVAVETPKAEEVTEGQGITEQDLVEINEARELLRSLNSLNTQESDADQMPPILDDVELIEDALHTIGDLGSKNQREVAENLMSLIVSSFDPKEVSTVGKYYDTIKKKFDAQYQPALGELIAAESKLEGLLRKFPEDKGISALLANIRATKDNVEVVSNNYKKFFAKAYGEAKKRGLVSASNDTELAEDIEAELDDHIAEEMYGKDLYKSSNETIHKDKIGAKLRRIFSNVFVGNTGFLGTPIPEDYDTIYNAVATYLSNPLPTDPSFDAMIKSLEKLEPSSPWVVSLIEQLNKAPEDVQHGFVSNMYKYAANAKFVNFASTKDGIDSSVWFSNANNVKQKIRTEWNNNFKRSAITNGDKINTEKLQGLIDTFESWGDNKHEQNDETLRSWLSDFGISLEDATWNDLKKSKLVVGEAGVKALPMAFTELFMSRSKSSNKSKNLFDHLYKYAKENVGNNAKNLDFTTNPKLIPFQNMGNIMKGLVDLEATHNTTLRNITRRDGDKTVSEIVFPSFFLNAMDKLINSANGDKKYLEELQKTAFSSNSMLLEMLIDEPEMADIFNFGEVGLMSMKNRYSKSPKFSKVDQISPIDYIFHQRAMFQDMKVENLPNSKDGFSMRVATMSTPTSSDKGRMMLMKTGVYDFYDTDLAFEADNNFAFTEDLKEILYKRLVLPELNRILNPQANDINGYVDGQGRFNMMPLLNTIEEGGISTLDFIKEGVAKGATATEIEVEFKDQYSKKINQYVQELLQNESNALLKEEETFSSENGYANDVDAINNNSYLKRDKNNYTPSQKKRASVLDYIINSNIHNMNVMQTISGDPAIYFKSKLDPKSADEVSQIQISKDLGINMGKRLALMIAPGNVISESKDEQYIQLFLNDNAVIAPNIDNIIGWHYGKAALKEEFDGKTYEQHIGDLRSGGITKKNLKQLEFRFAKVANFLNIENTDAQEYTTLREHLRVLRGTGKLTKEKEDEILDKVYKTKTPLSKQELEVVLNPMKPVYTGEKMERDADGNPTIRRIMYIKSSSFPLIPELVKGTDLEALMNKMEEIESKYGKKVRASYQSANKVGAMTQAIDPLKQSDLDKLDIVDDNTKGTSPLHSVVLDRINFKIQQEVPFKSDATGDDKVSMGTQIFKLLFGDGMADIKSGDFDGQELKDQFHTAFSQMINLSREGLIKELGLNEDYTPVDADSSMKKLQRLLLKEAEERNFSENDMKSFGIRVKEVNGKDVYYFKQPLWLSGNSNKIESMFNAIINNKIFKQKLPGNASVVASNNGITLKSQEDVSLNEVVYVGDYKGGELQGTEVLAPSKIKLNGKIIDLFESKNGEYIYIQRTGNGFVINEEKIDPVLFENFTFRTPTSSHGSGSNIKVVGFIPAIMGDLMITPSNFVTQMGQDFDVDKLTSYQFHHVLDKDGKVVKLNQEHIDEQIDNAKKKLYTAQKKFKELQDSKSPKRSVIEALSEFDMLMLTMFDVEDYEDLLQFNEDQIEERLRRAEEKLESLPRKMAMKMAQNEFIEIHNKVYGSQLAEVQKKINKVLSMDVAENQAEAIDTKVSSTALGVNLLSPTYQMDKLISGSTGTDAIGIYAKGVTFNSLAQQSGELRLTEKTKEGIFPKAIRIGNIKSNGTFGQIKNLSILGSNNIERELARSTAESLDERVNTGTDNEKAQILGRVGITHIKNVAVDNLLALLGIDLEITQIAKTTYNPSNPFHKTAIVGGNPVFYTEYSIPYLLHSQPIIAEYFKRLKNGRAIVGEFTSDLENKIYEDLLGKYTRKDTSEENLTGDNLLNGLGGDINTDLQKEALILYRKLMEDADALKELNQIVDLSNLGKSMWGAKEKITKFKELIRGDSDLNDKFSNTDSLLGTYNTSGKGLNMGDGEFFEPTTNQGVMVGSAISLSRNLFYDHFPYYNPYISGAIEDIIEGAGKTTGIVEHQEMIFQEMKKFITSSTDNGIFTTNPKATREDLFFEQEGSPSLSTYITEVLGIKEGTHIKGSDSLKNNVLISSMSYESGINGGPSLIKFDNTAAGNISDEDYHVAFKELLVSDETLPDRNGKPYTTRMLAQDLVAYSHLSGGIISQAIEFHKFIPIEYYDQMKVKVRTANGDIARVPITRVLQNYDPRLKSWSAGNRLDGFVTQFYQNNPGFAPKVGKTFKGKTVSFNENRSGLVIAFDQKDTPPSFVSSSNKVDGKREVELFEIIPGTHGYRKIDTVGVFGMSEYQHGSPYAVSNIVKPVSDPSSIVVQQIEVETAKPTPFEIKDTDTVKTLLEKVKNDSLPTNPALAEVATTLLDLFGDKAMDIKLVSDPNMGPEGSYDPNTNTLSIKPTGKNPAETFVHEFVHSVTSRYVNPFFDKSTGEISPDAPKEVQDLNKVFLDTANKIQGKYPEEFGAFKKKWDSHNAGDKTITFNERELSLFYPTINIKEYLAVSLSNNQIFLEETSKFKYEKGNIPLNKKFTKVMQRLFNLIAGVENNLAEQIVKSNLAFIESRAKNDYSTVANMEQSTSKEEAELASYEASLDDPFTDVEPEAVDLGDPDSIDTTKPTETSLMPPISIKYTNFEIDKIMPLNIKPCN